MKVNFSPKLNLIIKSFLVISVISLLTSTGPASALSLSSSNGTSVESANGTGLNAPVGTSSEVAAAVAASPTINDVSSAVGAQLDADAKGYDWPWTLYKGNDVGCTTITACVYGNINATSTNTIVLFGDSHAMMWLPAVAPYAVANNDKLILLWQRACPVANLPLGYYYEGGTEYGGGVIPGKVCISWRNSTIKTLNKMSPELVLLGERTSYIATKKGGKPYTEAEWQTDLEATINKLKSSSTKVAVIEDIPYHTSVVPDCLASNLSSVQACSVCVTGQKCAKDVPKNKYPGQETAELDSTKVTDTGFINTNQWYCTKTVCSSVIGNNITYWDQGHTSASYTHWLSGVMGQAISGLL